MIDHFDVDDDQYLLAQSMRFVQVLEPQDGTLVGQARDTCIQMCKLAVRRDVVQRLFHGRITTVKELLQQVNARRHLRRKRRAPRRALWRVRRNQRQQRGARSRQGQLV